MHLSEYLALPCQLLFQGGDRLGVLAQPQELVHLTQHGIVRFQAFLLLGSQRGTSGPLSGQEGTDPDKGKRANEPGQGSVSHGQLSQRSLARTKAPVGIKQTQSLPRWANRTAWIRGKWCLSRPRSCTNGS